jgi:hypothetical protein
MADPLEDFLKQAAQRRKQQQAATPPPAPPQPPRARKPEYSDRRAERQTGPVAAPEPTKRSIRRPEQPLPTAPQGGFETEAVGPRAADRTMRQLSASELGVEAGRADERMSEHMHERFDHALGALGGSVGTVMADQTLGSSTGETGTVSVGRGIDPELAASVREMLQNPRGIQQAIIINEILRRPLERWRSGPAPRPPAVQ